ncbi:hypothetical protein CR161_05980 [Prosthecochloris sp. ZM]|uniref:transposase family protein n=1 Tax=Prosthecochloris sp. ZM TaxID=2283143 RepID=UPI000DF77DFF|nr:transposase family protein [Prosthecochloris sp. ZM]RDD30295.1 hypothetical protein CR161_05980 [Prosthecochloris sp. ZM]
MQSLTTHYQQLLGLPSTWKVEDVDLSMLGKQVVIRLVYIGKHISCPECGDTCNIYDHAPEQKWRHLDEGSTALKATGTEFSFTVASSTW